MQILEVTIRKLFYLKANASHPSFNCEKGNRRLMLQLFLYILDHFIFGLISIFSPIPHPNLQSCPYVTSCLLPNMLSDLQSITKEKRRKKGRKTPAALYHLPKLLL